MQKTLTVRGKRFTGKVIAKKFDIQEMTNGGDYIIVLEGQKFFGQYREIQDDYFAPVCSKHKANAICVCPDYSYTYIWLNL